MSQTQAITFARDAITAEDSINDFIILRSGRLSLYLYRDAYDLFVGDRLIDKVEAEDNATEDELVSSVRETLESIDFGKIA